MLARVDRQQLRRLVTCAERALVQAKDLDVAMVQKARAHMLECKVALFACRNPLLAPCPPFATTPSAQVSRAINVACPEVIPSTFKQPMLHLLRGLTNSDPQRRGGLERRAKTTVALHIITGCVAAGVRARSIRMFSPHRHLWVACARVVWWHRASQFRRFCGRCLR